MPIVRTGDKREERLIFGMIMSKKVCGRFYSIVRKRREVIKSPYYQQVAVWCSNYYQKYRRNPGPEIRNIFEIERHEFKPEDRDMIEDILVDLDRRSADWALNEESLIDDSMNYIRKRLVQEITDLASVQLSTGRVEDAITEMTKEVEVLKGLSSEFDTGFNMLAQETLQHWIDNQDDESDILFQFPGAVGEIIGPLKRGWVLGVMGPAKRGKSFWLLEIALQAFLEKKRVLFVSLEMNRLEVEERFYKRITGMGDGQSINFPVWDCESNQDNSCKKKARAGLLGLWEYGEDGDLIREPIDWTINPKGYVPCSVCRETSKKDWKMATWFEKRRIPAITAKAIRRKLKGINLQWGSGFVSVVYPAFSANIGNIRAYLDYLKEEKDFEPDVIVIDYADILAPEDSRMDTRDRMDETWKTLKNLAASRHCLVVTASQTNRQSFARQNVQDTDAAEDIRKIANCDVMLALNQYGLEKDRNIMRVGIVAHRHRNFSKSVQALVLQNFSTAAALLDSERWVSKGGK